MVVEYTYNISQAGFASGMLLGHRPQRIPLPNFRLGYVGFISVMSSFIYTTSAISTKVDKLDPPNTMRLIPLVIFVVCYTLKHQDVIFFSLRLSHLSTAQTANEAPCFRARQQ